VRVALFPKKKERKRKKTRLFYLFYGYLLYLLVHCTWQIVYIFVHRHVYYKREEYIIEDRALDLSPHLERVARAALRGLIPLNLRFCKHSASHSPATADRSVWGSFLSPCFDFLACTPARSRKNNFISAIWKEIWRILLGIFIKVFLRRAEELGTATIKKAIQGRCHFKEWKMTL